MILLNVEYRVKPGQRERYYQLLNELGIPQASRAEAGNIAYDYFFSPDDGDLMFLREKWQDQEALDQHFAAPHFKKLSGIKEEWLLETKIDKTDL